MEGRGFLEFFPYREFKPEQKKAMDFVASAIESNSIGLVEAYCGFGKTIATFAPALSLGKKILLLTPSYAARNAAVAEALRINKEKGKRLVIADLRGRQAMCEKFSPALFSHELCQKAQKFEKNCEYCNKTLSKDGAELSAAAKRVLGEIIELQEKKPQIFFPKGALKKEPAFFQKFRESCAKKGLCSYELMKKLVGHADIIILDYFWCFTGIYHILAKIIDPKEFVLLVDEADLLVDRLYGDYALQLGLQSMHKLLAQSKQLAAQGLLQQTDTEFLEEFVRYCEELFETNMPEQPLSPEKIIDYFVSKFRKAAKRQGLQGTIGIETIIKNLKTIADAIKGAEDFEKASARPDIFLWYLNYIKDSRQYLTFLAKNKSRLSIKPFEINSIKLASGMTLLETINEFQSAILFSATIGDTALFEKELGLPKDTMVFKTREMPHKKLAVIIDTELNTTYNSREKNFPGYAKKIRALRKIDPSLLISCCNQLETEKIASAFPEIESAETAENLEEGKSYVLNIRTKHARSTNKAKVVRNCIVIGLPLPDYSDFYFQQRKKFLEQKYGRLEASKLANKKAIYTAIQLTGRITRNLSAPKAIILADNRYLHDYYLGDFYFNLIPDYLKGFVKTAKNTAELSKQLDSFWQSDKQLKKCLSCTRACNDCQ